MGGLILDDGINRIRDLVESDIGNCQSGTGTTAPTASDTGLETPDSNTLDTPTNTKTDKSIQVNFQIPSTTGATNAYSENEIQLNSGTDHLNRIVHTAITKGSNDEFNYITTIFFKSI